MFSVYGSSAAAQLHPTNWQQIEKSNALMNQNVFSITTIKIIWINQTIEGFTKIIKLTIEIGKYLYKLVVLSEHHRFVKNLNGKHSRLCP